MQPPQENTPRPGSRVRRRDRHGRGLRGVLVPPGVPLYRTRAERFDELVLQAVARLEPQWEAHLSTVEFAVEEIPPPDGPTGSARGPVPLSRLDLGSPSAQDAGPVSGLRRDVVIRPDPPSEPDLPAPAEAGTTSSGPDVLDPDVIDPETLDADVIEAEALDAGELAAGSAHGDAADAPPPAGEPPAGELSAAGSQAGRPGAGEPGGAVPPRIVVYRRPLLARADNEEELGELVFDVVVEEFGRLLGIDPKDVDPGYSADD